MNFTKSIGAYIDMKKVREIARRNGVDVDSPSIVQSVEEYRKTTEKGWNEAVEQKKKNELSSYSLFDGDQRVTFTFSMWKPDLQKNSEKAREVGKQAFLLAKEMIEKPEKVIMVGSPGVGKTSLALAMLDKASKAGQSTQFVSSAELSSLYDLRFDYPEVKSRISRIVSAMKKVDVLVLDDFGTEAGVNATKAVRRDLAAELEQVANARYDIEQNKTTKSTIITTNNSLEELQRVYGRKMISRLVPHNARQQIIFDGLTDMRE